MTDRLTEIEERWASSAEVPREESFWAEPYHDHVGWLIKEVKRLRYQLAIDLRSAESYGNSVSTENMKLQEEVKRLRAWVHSDICGNQCRCECGN